MGSTMKQKRRQRQRHTRQSSAANQQPLKGGSVPKPKVGNGKRKPFEMDWSNFQI